MPALSCCRVISEPSSSVYCFSDCDWVRLYAAQRLQDATTHKTGPVVGQATKQRLDICRQPPKFSAQVNRITEMYSFLSRPEPPSTVAPTSFMSTTAGSVSLRTRSVFSSTIMPSYHYRLLPPGYIRLLRLHPHQDEHAPIQCELIHYPLSGPRRGTHLYEALSYYWGPPEKTRTVFTEAGSLHITENLHAALRRLRDSSLERIIWADAICINQEDAEEKGCQVQLMAEIYARASRVIVWLEETTDDDQLGSGSQDSYEAIQAISLAASGSPTRSDSDEDGETDRKEQDLEAVVKLLNRAWFRRIWVRQHPTGGKTHGD